ncbi:MAG: transcriptional regulator [Clostridia bacterium]|jgi:two-component system response regulator YesN|nr:transcriptional regulator [Clostridia bacterium]
MIKIMIVDDMPIFRDYLVNCINWNLYGFEICYEAKHGKDALDQFNNYYPDIVLTDITMPYIDGLELAERLLEQYPDVAIVLITGNSEFEYARKALKLGVCDYIVKPFEKEELVLTLLKLQDNINKALEIQIEKNKISMEKREIELRKLIYTNNMASRLTFGSEFFLVCTIEIKKYEDPSRVEDIFNWEEIIIHMLRSMIEIDGKTEVFKDFEGNIVVLLSFEDKKQLMDYRGYELEDLIKLAKEHLKFDIMIGISDYCYKTEHIKKAYHESLQALSNQYKDKKNKIFDYKKVEVLGTNRFYSWDVIESINKNLEILHYNNIENIIIKELEDIEESLKSELVSMMYMSLLSLLLSFIVKLGRNIDDVFGTEFRPYELLNKSSDNSNKRSFILDCYKRAINYQMENMDTKAYLVAEDAKKYVEEHYGDPDLTIEHISRHLLVNQTYLRRMFKGEMNMTITEFLTKIRMEKAKELIINNEYKLTAISEMVGYSEPSYFSKCFKKYYGISPSGILLHKY